MQEQQEINLSDRGVFFIRVSEIAENISLSLFSFLIIFHCLLKLTPKFKDQYNQLKSSSPVSIVLLTLITQSNIYFSKS